AATARVGRITVLSVERGATIPAEWPGFGRRPRPSEAGRFPYVTSGSDLFSARGGKSSYETFRISWSSAGFVDWHAGAGRACPIIGKDAGHGFLPGTRHLCRGRGWPVCHTGRL